MSLLNEYDCAAGVFMRRYWVTTHWPIGFGDVEPHNVIESHHNIYVSKANSFVVASMQIDDIVFIYETEKGRKETKGIICHHGKQSVVTIAKVSAPAKQTKMPICNYTDGTSCDWSVCVEAPPLCSNGRVSRTYLNTILEYDSNYYLRGFGKNSSGVLEISEQQAQSLFANFCSNSVNK